MSSEARRAPLDWLSERLNVTEFLSILGSFGLIYVELDSRKPPRQALAEALARPLASYASGVRVLGMSVVVLVGFQMLTGALLALYYLPTPATAYESTALILRDVSFGWLIHQTHHWGAQLLVMALLLRIVRYLWHGIYRAPRELEWLLALALLAAAVAADLSGRLLLWSSDAYWFGIRVVEVLVGLPLVGSLMGTLLGGEGTYLSGLTLIRAYGLHAVILPAAFLLMIYLHFSGVRRLGLNENPGEAKIAGTPVLRRHLAEVAMIIVLTVAVLMTLAVLLPVPFPCAADPYATLPAIELPWYLLAPASLLVLTRGVVPSAAIGGVFVLVALGLVALPFVDRTRQAARWQRFLMAALVIAWLLLTFYGFEVGR
jgi:quinol-cytochrome oxidoreductase complex cytochrome b subunit